MECTNVLCNFANRLAQTNINVSYHNAANSLLAGGGPSQVPTITISAHVGTAIDITWSAAVEDGVGEVREGVGRLRKLDETAFELVWREQETFELEISVNTPKDFDTDPTVDVGVRLTENVTAHDILFVLDSSFEVQKLSFQRYDPNCANSVCTEEGFNATLTASVDTSLHELPIDRKSVV